MSMGAIIYNSERARIYSISFPYYYASFVYAIPPGRPYTPLEVIFIPFKIFVWLCICTIFLGTVLVVFALKVGNYRARAFVLGPIIDVMPTRNFARTILLIWIMMSMVLKMAYQDRLYQFLRTQPHRSPYDTRPKIYASDVKIFVTETFYQTFYESLPANRDR